MSAEVDWDFARQVAGKVSKREPFASSYLMQGLNEDLLELTAQAEHLVAVETGLESQAGSAKAKVADRMEWVDANLASFDRLLRPLFGRLDEELDHANSEADDASQGEPGWFSSSPLGQRLGPVLDPVLEAVTPAAEAAAAAAGRVSDRVSPKFAGAQVGALLGWMSGRVLGQYDLLIIEDERPEDQDWVYYVGPNILALEKQFGFPAREFRLWIAVHECTHRAQFTGVPWLRPYFLSLVNELLDAVDPDPKRLVDTVKDLAEQRRSGTGPSLNDGGLSALLATPEQRATMDKVTGLMSLLEGHGDITMDRAAADLIPSQERFARVMSERRKNATGLTKVIHRLTGLEAKLAQYEEGEAFVHAVEAAGGRPLFDEVWSAPEALPTIAEIRDPDLWITRIKNS